MRRRRMSKTVSRTSDSTSSTIDTAAAAPGWSPSIEALDVDGATSVLNGMLPEMSTTDPNSPIHRAKPERATGQDRGCQVGEHDRRITVSGDAPSEAAASSMSRSSSSSTGWTDRTMKGSVTNSSAMRIETGW